MRDGFGLGSDLEDHSGASLAGVPAAAATGRAVEIAVGMGRVANGLNALATRWR
jgi:hypothetical protein